MKIIWQDVVIIIGFLLYIGCGIATKMILARVSLYTEHAEELEANPLARKIVNTRFGIIIMQALAISFMSGVYWMMRRTHMKKAHETSYQILSFYTIALTMMFLQNFLNDFPILLGILKG